MTGFKRKITALAVAFVFIGGFGDFRTYAATETAEYKAAKQAVKEAKAEVAEIQEMIDSGSLGFFTWVGDDLAVQIIKDGIKDAKADGLTFGVTSPGASYDATSLDNMKATFDFIRQGNKLRTTDDLFPGCKSLLVSDRMMALAQINANHASEVIGHWSIELGKYYCGENLAWNYANPFTGWYTAEKENYIKGSGATGHYLNIVDSGYVVTGYGINTNTKGMFDNAHCQDFGASYAMYGMDGGYGTAYTVDEYEKRFNDYCTKIKKELKTAKTKLKAAQEYLDSFTQNGFSLAVTSATVEVGNTAMVKPVYRYENSDIQVTLSSSKPAYATVDPDGTVHGLKVGNTVITASSSGNKVTCNVQVLFTDVPASGVYYSKPVYWAVGKKITYGYTDEDGLAREFRPQLECTRAQMVTFLWRLAGKPEPVTEECTFTDITEEDYYYKAVLWAAEKEITKGYADDNYTTFRPDETCLREHAVTFLYRYAGKPSVKKAKNTFMDVSKEDYFYKPVLWAVANNITKGYEDDDFTTFRPQNSCLREHIVTFMYRYAN